MAVLLSSLFVYNQLGAIDEAALDRLALVSEVSRNLAGKASGDDVGVPSYAPSFLWLLRDFYLDLTDDGRPITPRDYLEMALRPAAGSGPAVESKNNIRRSICALFPRRECHALVRPVSDERLLQQLDDVPQDKLRPEFVAGVQALTSAVLQLAGPKRLGGDILNGAALARLTETYVHALNAGAVPPIASAWEAVASAECAAAAAAGDAAYETAFSAARQANPAAEADAMQAAHTAALDAAKAAFVTAAVGPAAVRDVHWSRLLTSVERRIVDRKARAFAEAAAVNADLLQAANAALTAAVSAPSASIESIFAAADGQAEAYMRQAQGPHKAEKLVAWLRNSLNGPIRTAAVSRVKTAQDALRAAKVAAEEGQRTAATASRCEAEAKQEAIALKERLAAAQQAASAAGRSASAAREQAAAAAAAAQEQAQCAQELNNRVASASAELASLRARLEHAQTETQQAQRDAQVAREEARVAGARVTSEAAARSNAERNAEKAAREAAAADAAAAAAAARAKAEMQASLANKVATFQGEADAAVVSAKRFKRGSVIVEAGPSPSTGARGDGPSAMDATPVAVPPPPSPAANMSVAALKAALVEAGHQDAVAQLATRKPAPKKEAFVELYSKLLGGGT